MQTLYPHTRNHAKPDASQLGKVKEKNLKKIHNMTKRNQQKN